MATILFRWMLAWTTLILRARSSTKRTTSTLQIVMETIWSHKWITITRCCKASQPLSIKEATPSLISNSSIARLLTTPTTSSTLTTMCHLEARATAALRNILLSFKAVMLKVTSTKTITRLVERPSTSISSRTPNLQVLVVTTPNSPRSSASTRMGPTPPMVAVAPWEALFRRASPNWVNLRETTQILWTTQAKANISEPKVIIRLRCFPSSSLPRDPSEWLDITTALITFQLKWCCSNISRNLKLKACQSDRSNHSWFKKVDLICQKVKKFHLKYKQLQNNFHFLKT